MSVRNQFYGSVMLLLVYDCCYCYCSLKYLKILLLYFAFDAAIAALQVIMPVHNKLYTIYNAVIMSLCAQLQSILLMLLMLVCSIQ